MLKTAEEIAKLLSDRSFAERAMTQVSKGSKGSFTYVPWNETVHILDEVYGHFGWSAELVDRETIVSDGAYVYTVGLKLSVSAVTPNGSVITVSRPGVGVGIASKNKDGYLAPDAHDTAAKAARSDALSTAAKMCGDAFGLFLYDKGDPARQESSSNVSGQSNSTSQQTRSTNGTSGVKRNPWGGIGKASEKRTEMMLKQGYSEEQIDAMDKDTVAAVCEAIVNKGTAPVQPANPPTKKPVAPKVSATPVAAGDIPF
jgi:recombination DNA repair RAD52 pathway protein